MKQLSSILKLFVLIPMPFILGSFNLNSKFLVPQKTASNLNKKTQCGMDIYAINTTSKTVDFVKFISSVETETFNNLGGNSGVFSWDTNDGGFDIQVKLQSYPGTGRIRVFRELTQVYCSNFNNVSSSITLTIEIFDNSCPGAYYVYIEPNNC